MARAPRYGLSRQLWRPRGVSHRRGVGSTLRGRQSVWLYLRLRRVFEMRLRIPFVTTFVWTGRCWRYGQRTDNGTRRLRSCDYKRRVSRGSGADTTAPVNRSKFRMIRQDVVSTSSVVGVVLAGRLASVLHRRGGVCCWRNRTRRTTGISWGGAPRPNSFSNF